MGSRRENTFQLVGFDFLIDEDFRVWLIEVNDNPYLGYSNANMAILVPQMISDMFKLTVDNKYTPAIRQTVDNHFDLVCGGETNLREPLVLQNLYIH